MREALFEEICPGEAQQGSSGINMRKTILKHIIVKLVKTKGKRKLAGGQGATVPSSEKL